jgi:hypothetical protein
MAWLLRVPRVRRSGDPGLWSLTASRYRQRSLTASRYRQPSLTASRYRQPSLTASRYRQRSLTASRYRQRSQRRTSPLRLRLSRPGLVGPFFEGLLASPTDGCIQFPGQARKRQISDFYLQSIVPTSTSLMRVFSSFACSRSLRLRPASQRPPTERANCDTTYGNRPRPAGRPQVPIVGHQSFEGVGPRRPPQSLPHLELISWRTSHPNAEALH